MTYKYIGTALLSLTLVGILLQYLIFHSWLIGICGDQIYCLDSSVYMGIGEPLYWGLPWLLPLCVVLIFIRKEVFDIWWKIVLPLSVAAIILIVKTPYEYFGITFYLLDRTQVTDRMVWLIDLISAVIIIWKYWQLWRVEKKVTGSSATS